VVPIAVIGGLVFFVAGAIQQLGIVTATVINTGLLTALYVVATPFASWAIDRRRPPIFIWIPVGLALLGVWGLSGGSLGNLSRGDALVALAAAIWGIQIVVTGRAGEKAQPLTYTFIQFVVVASIALSMAAALEPISSRAVFAAASSILYVGLLSSALTFGLMAVALQNISAPRAAVLLSSEVLFSAAAGYVLLDERLPPVGWAGAAAILAAILLVRARGKQSR
jgi:drug/metabolite transporter (DMT)-like permease